MTLGPVSTRKRWPLAIVALTLLVSAALAGCADAPEEQSEEDEEDPWNDGALSDPGPSTSTDVEAVLDAEADGWAGENFTFDGSRSSASNGEIVMLRFDFGDGTTEEIPRPIKPSSSTTTPRAGCTW